MPLNFGKEKKRTLKREFIEIEMQLEDIYDKNLLSFSYD